MDRLLTIADLADVLRLSPKTIKNRRPEDLPKAVRLSGHRGRRWRESDVRAWLASLPSTQGAQPQSNAEPRSSRPGPKRKVEQ